MRSLLLCLVAMMPLAGCVMDLAPEKPPHRFGERAKDAAESKAGRNKQTLPASASNFYTFDFGNVFGMNEYFAFDCGSEADCWKAIAALDGPAAEKFLPWAPSRFAVVMDGPAFYTKIYSADKDPDRKRAAEAWNVRAIKNGKFHERVEMRNDHPERIYFYAVDLDRLRVYFHYESGGVAE